MSKAELEQQIEMRVNEIHALNRQLEEEESGQEEGVESPIPPYVNVALTALRLLHRSLKLEHKSDSEQSSEGEGEFGKVTNASEKHASTCRKLTKDEESLRSGCCLAISSYLDASRLDAETRRIARDSADTELSE
jgi:hypothetical protein